MDEQHGGLTREQYTAERQSVIQGLQAAAGQHDKAILTLSAGAFGLSLAFLRNIGPEGEVAWSCSLILAWFFLLVSIAAVLISFHLSVLTHLRYCDELDSRWRDDKPRQGNSTTGLRRATLVANWVSFATLILGLLLLAVFCGNNLR